jgi:hypothetical protein
MFILRYLVSTSVWAMTNPLASEQDSFFLQLFDLLEIIY